MHRPSKADLIWAAGLFDGEGCVTSARDKRGRPYPMLHLGMRDKRTVHAFATIMGTGTVCFSASEMYTWNVSYLKARQAAQLLVRYCRLKRKQLEVMLLLCDTFPLHQWHREGIPRGATRISLSIARRREYYARRLKELKRWKH